MKKAMKMKITKNGIQILKINNFKNYRKAGKQGNNQLARKGKRSKF